MAEPDSARSLQGCTDHAPAPAHTGAPEGLALGTGQEQSSGSGVKEQVPVVSRTRHGAASTDASPRRTLRQGGHPAHAGSAKQAARCRSPTSLGSPTCPASARPCGRWPWVICPMQARWVLV